MLAAYCSVEARCGLRRGDAFADRFTVTEIAVLGGADTMDDPGTPNAVVRRTTGVVIYP
jgi:hypothetical protein